MVAGAAARGREPAGVCAEGASLWSARPPVAGAAAPRVSIAEAGAAVRVWAGGINTALSAWQTSRRVEFPSDEKLETLEIFLTKHMRT